VPGILGEIERFMNVHAVTSINFISEQSLLVYSYVALMMS
jgi:hypothetical protein